MIITVAVTRYVSLGSMVAAATVAVLIALLWGHVSPDADAALAGRCTGGVADTR